MSAMLKPCRLEMSASGTWKLLGRFDAGNDRNTDDVLNAAADLVDALNVTAERKTTLRVVTDEGVPDLLMQYESHKEGWRDLAGNPL